MIPPMPRRVNMGPNLVFSTSIISASSMMDGPKLFINLCFYFYFFYFKWCTKGIDEHSEDYEGVCVGEGTLFFP